MTKAADPHRIAVVAMPGVLTLDFGIPLHAFDFEAYSVTVCGEGPVEDFQGHTVMTPPAPLDVIDSADTVIVPGYLPVSIPPSEQVIDRLQSAFARGARVASICVGAFALGHAGLLDRHRATTHWQFIDSLATQFPLVDVRRDVLYVAEERVCTSAGVASGIDLCLEMIRTDYGAAVANQRGRVLVAAPHRNGDQRPFIEYFAPRPRGDLVSSTRAWILGCLQQSLTLTDMAAHANMSTRNFSRRFIAETGMTPAKWLQAARIDRARELLEASDESIERIGRLAGLGTAANFRRIFVQHVGIMPSEYRRMYRG
jgi:transcriptional regulator GlxA family with amidase domain